MTTQTTTIRQHRTSSAQRWVLVLSSLASFMVILDMLVVATALNSIQRSMGASLVDLEWTVNAYALSFAVFLMTAATLGGRLGRRRVFVAGLAVFGLASVACALAPNVGVLVAARAVQGLGAAAVMPMALALLNMTFPAERRGWATGIYGSIGASAVVVGPILGGLVAQGLSWEWIFWLNVPIALAAIPFVLTHLPEGYGPVIPIDLPGLGLAAAGAFGLVWGLIRANDAGWSDPSVLGLLVGGAVLSVVFVGWERQARVPMLPLRLFRSPAFSAGSVVIFLLNGALTAAVFFTAQYLQIGLGNGPLSAGLRLAPWGIAPLLLAARAGALADRLGERLLVVVGMLLLAGGMGWLALVADPDTDYVAIVLPLVITGVGNAVAIPAVTKAVVSSVALPDIGAASGTYSTMRQLGGAFGVAVIGAVFAVTGGYGSASDFSDGYRAAIGACAGVAVVGAAAGLALGRRRTASAPEAAPQPSRPMAVASQPVEPTR